GETRAALVKENQTRERGQPAKESGDHRLFPTVFDVAHPARHIDQIDRTVADHLIRNVYVATLGVMRFRTGLVSGELKGLGLDLNSRRESRAKGFGREFFRRARDERGPINAAEL